MTLKWKQIALLALLCSTACVYALQFIYWNTSSAIDFRNIYLAVRMWQEGMDPYQDGQLKAFWQQVCAESGIIPLSKPGLPNNFLVYPPGVVWLYLPFSMLDWTTAYLINALLITCTLCATVWLWIQMSPVPLQPIQKALVWACVFACKGSLHAIFVGQPTLLLILIGTIAIYTHVKHGHAWISIAALTILSVKPTLAFPFVLYFVHHRKVKWLAISGIIICVLHVSATFMWSTSPILIRSFIYNVQLLKNLVYSHFDYTTTLTEFTVLVHNVYLFPTEFYNAIHLIGAMILVIVAWVKPPKLPLMVSCSILFIAALLISYHLFYDILVLIPLVVYAVTHRMPLWGYLAALPFFIPVNGILNRVPHPPALDWLYLHVPATLICLLIWLFTYLRTKQA